jgi:two-component system heavy metal sensor histidine kinase CusS
MTRPGHRRSIRWRASIAFALTCALVLGMVGLYLYRSLAAELAYRDDLALMGRLEQVRALLQDSDDLNVLRQRPGLYQNMLGNQESLLLVSQHTGEPLISINPHNDPIPALDVIALGQTPRREQITLWQPPASSALLLLAGQARGRQGEALQVIVGKRLSERTAMLAGYRARIYAAVAVGALTALLLGLLLLRQALRPLRQIARSVANIGLNNLDRRLALDPVPNELYEPVQALNAMLARLDESFARLARFSADLAHEMRTPLHALLSSNGQVLSQPRTQAEYEEILASNIEQFERLNRMVANLLFLARADHGACPLALATLELHAMGEALCDYFQALAQDRDLTLSNELDGELTADPALLQRALANLLANALRHATPGTKVTLISRRGPGVHTLSVSNQGAAIAPEHLPRVFERFYRADHTRTDPTDSGGLGLAIVESIMVLHQGSAEVASGPGETLFTLVFKSE